MAKSGAIKSLELSRKIPANMKAIIRPYITSSSRYKNGMFFGIRQPEGMSKISRKISGVSMGADKGGFFVYTHRARGKSYKNPLKIPKKEIEFIESTG
jgi:hypothetical protein